MEQKEYLDLSCRFARRKIYDKEKKKYTHYISGETVVDEEKIRFKLNDKDSRLFQYMLKKMGLNLYCGGSFRLCVRKESAFAAVRQYPIAKRNADRRSKQAHGVCENVQ